MCRPFAEAEMQEGNLEEVIKSAAEREREPKAEGKGIGSKEL